MFIVVNIGDIVGYSDCGYFFNKNKAGIRDNAFELVESDCSIEFENDMDRICVTYENSDNSQEFDVFENHEVSNDWKCLLIGWHCFDGIESTVREFNSAIEAKEKMKLEVAELGGEIELKSDNKVVVDTGNEWVGWRILTREEVE